ncbi:MAG: hypothetical protein A2355_15665, partial [Spirochaetes bacterium RIFOXYB1_FULL_32_8]
MKKLEVIKKVLISFVMFFMSYIIPKNKRKIVLGSSIGIKFNGNPKYLFIRLSRDKIYSKFTTIWLTKTERVVGKLKKEHLNVEKIGTVQSLIQLIRAKWIIIDNTPEDVFIWPFLFGRFNVINTWHGVPIKKIGKDYQTPREETGKFRVVYNIFNRIFGFNSKHHETMIANSEQDLANMKSAFSPKKIFLTGYPRNDIFSNRRYFEVENERERLGLKKYKKVFLYAPTYRPYLKVLPSFSREFLRKLNVYLTKNNYLLLVSAHLSTSKVEVEEFERIKYVSEFEDTQELLTNIDVLISDYSGSIVDFSLTGKPIIFYCYDLIEYAKKVGLYYDYDKVFRKLISKNENELFSMITHLNKNKTEYSK